VWPIGILFGLGGLTGLAYQTNVVVKRHQFGLALHDWHDWLPYVGVPALGSACLVVGAVGLIIENALAPYAVAGATTLLLFAGVYGAWDLTLWIIKNRDKTERPNNMPGSEKSAP
jgi:ABC-type transporter lipoprotein component MlaA